MYCTSVQILHNGEMGLKFCHTHDSIGFNVSRTMVMTSKPGYIEMYSFFSSVAVRDEIIAFKVCAIFLYKKVTNFVSNKYHPATS